MKQHSINVLLPVHAGRVAALSSWITGLDAQAEFGDVPGLHFLSLSLLPAFDPENPAHFLLCECNIDGGAREFLERFWQQESVLLTSLLEYTELPVAKSASEFAAIMLAYDQGEGASHIALPGMDLEMIRQSVELFDTARKVYRSFASHALPPSQLCRQLADDKRVREKLLRIPAAWPGERMKSFLRLGVFALSAVLVMLMLAASSLAPLAAGGAEVASLLILFWLPLLVWQLFKSLSSPARGSPPPRWQVYKLCCWIVFGLTLLLVIVILYRRGHLLELIFSLGILAVWLTLLIVRLQWVPVTCQTEHFLMAALPVIYLLPVVLMLLHWYGGQDLALAADVLLVSLALATVGGLIVLRDLLLNLLDTGGLVFGVVLYLLLPFSLPDLAVLAAQIISLVLLLAALVMFGLLCRLQMQERLDYESPPVWEDGPLRQQITTIESTRCNRQNHLLSVTRIKQGRLRLFALEVVLKLVVALSRFDGKRSELSGIVTIHFARWIIIGRDRSHLLFMSNYSGNWGSYLDEFVDNASTGMTAIWSNTEGFPRSAWLRYEGAHHEQRFKQYARRSMLPTLLHYSAYPHLTVDQIESYTRLSEILSKAEPTEWECQEVLRML